MTDELLLPKNRVEIIGLCGQKGVGKSTLAAYFTKYSDYAVLSFATPLKVGISNMFNLAWNDLIDHIKKEQLIPGQKFTIRKAMQVIGTECGRHLDEDIWIRLMHQAILNRIKYVDEHLSVSSEGLLDNEPIKIVIDDVRFRNEADYIVLNGGQLIYLEPSFEHVNASKEESKGKTKENKHSSEDFSWIRNFDHSRAIFETVDRFRSVEHYRQQISNYACLHLLAKEKQKMVNLYYSKQ